MGRFAGKRGYLANEGAGDSTLEVLDMLDVLEFPDKFQSSSPICHHSRRRWKPMAGTELLRFGQNGRERLSGYKFHQIPKFPSL